MVIRIIISMKMRCRPIPFKMITLYMYSDFCYMYIILFPNSLYLGTIYKVKLGMVSYIGCVQSFKESQYIYNPFFVIFSLLYVVRLDCKFVNREIHIIYNSEIYL